MSVSDRPEGRPRPRPALAATFASSSLASAEAWALRPKGYLPRALPRRVALKYCEFEPTQHRNKRVAQFVFLDEPGDPHPLAICDVCAKKLKSMRPDAIVKERKDHEKDKKAAKKEAAAAAPAEEPKAE